MNIIEYWKEKTVVLENAFEKWERSDELQLRKLLVASVMEIPQEQISFYLKRDVWLLKFALGDDSPIMRSFAQEESTINKVNQVLEDKFYKPDYEVLCKMKGYQNTLDTVTKKNVCDMIRELVEQDVYEKLDGEYRGRLDLYEKIYFEPIELFNEYVEENAGSEAYYTMLTEQWKTANEMAANISEQRNNMNNFYMSLMSVLIGGILLSDQMPDANIMSKTVLYVAMLVIGVVCCQKWISQIDNYGRLNAAKYDVINELERKLPANVLLCEYKRTEKNARKSKNKISFSQQEKDIAKLFRYVVIIVPMLMLCGTWGEIIWELIQSVLSMI